MNEETLLIGFKAICNFINDLESVYGKKHKPLKLYKRLINHTQISHDQAIRKHIAIFYQFCSANQEALTTRDKTKLTSTRLEYSERVFVDMGYILGVADSETTDVIWRHLLTISAILDPSGKAKEVLRKATAEGKTGKEESDFLTNIISKVEKNVKPDSNPMEAISSMMQSGVFNEMLSDLGSKKLDMSKLLGAVQGMVAGLGNQLGDDPEAKQALGMLTNMTGMLGGGAGNGQAPDMAGMMQMMSGLMAGASAGSTPTLPSVETKKL